MKTIGFIFLTIFGLVFLVAPLVWMVSVSASNRVTIVPAIETRMVDGEWREVESEIIPPAAVINVNEGEANSIRREGFESGSVSVYETPPKPIDAGNRTIGIGIPEMGAILLVMSFWGLLIFLAMRALARPKGGKSGELNPDETRMIQEIYRGLSSMEQRIESLETILIERYKNRPVPCD